MMRTLLALCLLLASLSAAHAAAPPPQWLPRESWPGGKQYDPRLERTVKFWGTGVPAAKLFASIAEQTGVPLAFSPADDDNARVCLNVYLNPKEPPTLRDLLVQIGWVMDCAWVVEGEGEHSRYALLHTSIGNGALARRRRAAEEESAAQEQEQRKILQRLRPRAKARLLELAADLQLNREEAIKRYRGRDDLKLLVLLDPVRRASARFFLASPELLDESDAPWSEAQLQWSQLTTEQRALVREMVEAEAARGGLPAPSEVDWDDAAALTRLGLTVSVHVGGGGFSCQVEHPTEGPDPDVQYHQGLASASFELVTDPEVMDYSPVDREVQLRGLLGEEVPQEEWMKLTEQYEQQQRREGIRWRAERDLSERGPALSQNAPLLASLLLPIELDKPYALWQLQELVASLSGLQVISDCFSQPAQSVGDWVEVLYPDGPPQPTALTVLRLACVPRNGLGDLHQRPEPPYPWDSDGWEWGDAGRFLRFRSRHRDLWRAALLPKETAPALDAWLAPYLPKETGSQATLPEVEVPLDPIEQGRLLVGLTEEQRPWGALIADGDPADAAAAYRQAFREGVLAAGAHTNSPYALLARLDHEQLRGLMGDGLTLGVDIPLSSMPPGPLLHDERAVVKGDTVQLVAPEPGSAGTAVIEGQPAPPYRTTQWWEARITSQDGGIMGLGLVPRNLLLHPARLAHLVSPPR